MNNIGAIIESAKRIMSEKDLNEFITELGVAEALGSSPAGAVLIGMCILEYIGFPRSSMRYWAKSKLILSDCGTVIMIGMRLKDRLCLAERYCSQFNGCRYDCLSIKYYSRTGLKKWR